MELYSVYRGTTTNPAQAQLVQSEIAATEFMDTSIETGKNYYYWVTAQKEDKESVFSNRTLGYAVGDALNTVRASDGLHRNRVTVAWAAHEDADSYTIFRSLSEDAETAVAIASGITALSFNDDTAEKGVVYSYWVRVKQLDNLTGFSNRDSGHRPLSGDSSVVAWGDNEYGESNVPHEELVATPSSAPATLSILADTPAEIIRVAGSVAHSLALNSKGELVAWGDNRNSQSTDPDDLAELSQITAGEEHNLVVEGYASPAIESILPASSSIELGQDLLLRARASGAADLRYQWYRDGVAIEGANSDTLLLPGIRANNRGNYTLAATSKGETARSESIPVVVTIGGKLAGFIKGAAAHAIIGANGDWVSTGLQTDPEGKRIRFVKSGNPAEFVKSGTHAIGAYIHDDEWASEEHPVTLQLHNLSFASDAFSVTDTSQTTTIRYRAINGFHCKLSRSANLKDWEPLATRESGDGLDHQLEIPFEPGFFYRVEYSLP